MEQLRGVPTQYEVKRNNRWEFVFPEEFGIKSWLCQTVNLPNFILGEKSEKTLDYIKLRLINPITIPTDIILFNNFINENKYNFECRLYLLDPVGERVTKWTLLIKEVSQINFGNLNYGDDSLNEIEMVLTVDKATITNVFSV